MGTWDNAPPSPPGVPAVRDAAAEYNSRVGKPTDEQADQLNRFVMELHTGNPVAVALLGITDLVLDAYEVAKRMSQTP